MTGYLQREIRTAVASAMKSMPVVVITGMRQTGKTTFLHNEPLLKNHRYVTLDDFATLQSALSQPEFLFESGEGVCIDEAQKAPGLLIAVKRAVDRDRAAGRFVLSGSANFSLLKGISETLAGRAVYLTLQPFSRREMHGAIRDVPLMVKLLAGTIGPPVSRGNPVSSTDILRGGMPSVRGFAAADASVWFQGFEQTYIERDIRDLARIDDMLGFRTAIKLASLRGGQILNMSQLARDARLSPITTTRYLQLAETSFLFRRLPPFLRNRSSRLIKSPKLYVADSGLAAHLADVESIEAGDDEPMRGVLFETYALQNMSAILEAHLPGARISYWHVQGRHEVDFILEYKKSCIAVEAKAATRWSDGDLASLKVFMDKTPSCRAGILAYNGTQTAKLGEKLWAVPLGTILS
jgi:predicted AAA+ superfamily ATPase